MTMRFIMMHKTEEKWEAGILPSPGLIAGMGKLLEEMTNAGVLLSAGGLRPSSQGVRLNFSGGKRTVTDGPFTESKELIAGFVMLQVKAIEEAIPWASRFATVVGDVEIDVRPLHETSDVA